MSRHESFWAATAETPLCAPLAENVHVDVCVVGAGIAGITTAYLLARAGKSVVVLDDGPIGGGMTQMTSAHLTHAIDDRYYELERLHGRVAARRAAESHTAAISRIETIARQERIECQFERVDGYLFLAEGDREETLDRELDAAQRAGLSSVRKLPRAPYASFDTGPCLGFPHQAQFHPLMYLAGLAQALHRARGRIYCGSRAERIEGGTPAVVRVGSHIVTANAVVVATNVPVNDRVAIHTKQAPYMTYVIGARVPRGAVPRVLAWDTGDPYHYVRVAGLDDDDVLIVGGEDHKSGQADDAGQRHERLEAWTRSRFPMAREVAFRWSGQVMEPVDYLSFTGRNPMDADNVYIHTGDSGMGLTHGTIAGMLLSDLIRGRDNPWARLYDPSRKPGEVASVDELARESGAVMRRGLHKIAVCRDAQGALHERSAVCPHLGCIVHWNDAAKTWDCPCHGSRFDCEGHVLNGPANRDLAPAEPSEKKQAA